MQYSRKKYIVSLLLHILDGQHKNLKLCTFHTPEVQMFDMPVLWMTSKRIKIGGSLA
jgi:hypothetical protein